MVVWDYVSLAKIEFYFPEFLFLYYSKSELAKREIYMRFGEQKWHIIHIHPGD